MRKTSLSAVAALALLALAAVAAWAQSATFVPSEPGNIFTVINYSRARGQARATVVTLTQGSRFLSRTVAAPYQRCRETTPAGFVIKLRNPVPSDEPITISTNGTIVRGPYIGARPAESLHPCYRDVTF